MKAVGAELMISVIHLAGPPVRVGGFMTQRCLLCGRVIVHLDLERFAEVIETEEGEQFRIMVAVPNSLVRVTDRPRLFGPSDRTIELVRRIQNTADAFAGVWELPPGTCVGRPFIYNLARRAAGLWVLPHGAGAACAGCVCC